MLVVASPVLARDDKARIAALVASTDGATRETAYKVASVEDEYAILRARHLRSGEQSLILGEGDDKGAYDTLEAADRNGAKLTLWFDISSFFGTGLGL
jgi:hypothetical protein